MHRDALERRYRRLVAAYPPGHRAVYAEDMIGLLMAGTEPGRSRPSLATGFDLLKGAVAAWGLRVRSQARSWNRTDAAAALTALALLALSTLSVTGVGMVLDDEVGNSYGGWGRAALWLPHLIWLPVTIAAAVGRQRIAAWTAWTAGIALPLAGSVVTSNGWTPGYISSVDSTAWFAVALIAALGLSSASGSRSSFEVLGVRAALLATLGSTLVAGAAVALPTDTVSGRHDLVGSALMATGLALIGVAWFRAVVPLGRTLTWVTSVVIIGLFGLALGYAWLDPGSGYSNWAEAIDTVLPVMLLACGFVAVTATPRPAATVQTA